jgi:Cof subfamily protein (haloacid dehalogenase superfamily)
MKVVCFDLDMTLLDHYTMEISPNTLRTIETLRKTAKIVLATGRNMNLEGNVHLVELLRPDAVIHMNGTRVETEGVILSEKFLDSEVVNAIVSRAFDMKWCVGISQDSLMYTTHHQAIIDLDTKRFGQCDRKFGEIRNILGRDFNSLTVWEDAASIDKMALEFPMVSFTKFSQAFGADILPLNLSKATGMSYLLNHWGYEFKDVISVGDSMNDYELLKQSGLGIAMGNADEKVKRIADMITDDISKEGVLNAFAKLGMI